MSCLVGPPRGVKRLQKWEDKWPLAIEVPLLRGVQERAPAGNPWRAHKSRPWCFVDGQKQLKASAKPRKHKASYDTNSKKTFPTPFSIFLSMSALWVTKVSWGWQGKNWGKKNNPQSFPSFSLQANCQKQSSRHQKNIASCNRLWTTRCFPSESIYLSLNKYWLRMYYVSNPVLDTGRDPKNNNTWTLPRASVHRLK